MYYIIETKYVGFNKNQDQYCDQHIIEISTSPAITNMSKETRIDGWCGTTNDFSIYAHGEYLTLDEARAAITEIFGDVRNAGGSDNQNIVETYKMGKYTPMSREATANWTYEYIQSDIHAETTDQRIAELIAECEAEANEIGYTLDSDLKKLMQQRREELLAN